MSDTKVLEFIGTQGLPHSMQVKIDMVMPYELAIKILDLIQKEMPADAPSDETAASA